MAFEGPQTNTTTVDRIVVNLDDGTLPKQEFERYLERLRAFQKRIGYEFNDEALLIRALTSTSYSKATNGKVSHKGAMEPKGDGLLKQKVVYWVRGYTNRDNHLYSTQIPHFLNSNVFLSLVGFRIGIADCIRFSHQKMESVGGSEKQIRMLANFVEALIDAVYEDGGQRALIPFMETHVLPPPKKGTVTHLVPYLFGDSKELREQAFRLYTNGRASIDVRPHKRLFKGLVYLNEKEGRGRYPVFQTNGASKFRREAAAEAIIGFSKHYPWVVWGCEGPTSLIFPTVIDNTTK